MSSQEYTAEASSGLGAQQLSLTDLPTLNHYNKMLFFERFQQTVFGTKEYEGSLPAAWDTAEHIDAGTELGVGEYDLSEQHRHQIATAVVRMKNAGITSAVIEAAHLYMYEDLNDPSIEKSVLSQTYFASALTKELETAGIDVRQILFVDDYNPDPSDGECHERLAVSDLVDLTRSTGYRPELILREGSMVDLAKVIIDIMKEEQQLVTASEIDILEGLDVNPAALFLSYRNIELYRSSDDTVSCAMLDTALTALKFRYLGEGVINILPRRSSGQQFSYRSQQRKMRTIVGQHLNVRVVPIFNLFTGVDQNDEIATGAHHALRKPH